MNRLIYLSSSAVVRCAVKEGIKNGANVQLAARLSTSAALRDTITTKPKDSPEQPKFHGHKLNSLEKKMLVWTKKYKTVEDVPNYVSYAGIEDARSKARIKGMNYMMVATLIACCVMVYSGKQAAKRGDSVFKQNVEWHQKQKEIALAKEQKEQQQQH